MSLRWHVRGWCALLVASTLSTTLFWAVPTEIVLLEAEQHRASTQAWLQQWQERCTNRSAWRCRTRVLAQHQHQAPWIQHVASRRLGWRTTGWITQEHEAVATWYRGGVFVAEGVWLPLAHEATSHVPVLEGPESFKMQIWKDWQRLQTFWSPHLPAVERVEVNRRGAWVLCLADGVQVLLGSDQHEARVQRFVKSYGRVVTRHARGFAYVDLRYTEGMALGWRNAASSNPPAWVQG